MFWDVMVLPEQQCLSVRNGFSSSAVGLEASGGYERGVMRALLGASDQSVQVAAVRQH